MFAVVELEGQEVDGEYRRIVARYQYGLAADWF